MPRLNGWLSSTPTLNSKPPDEVQTRAINTLRRINENPLPVTFETPTGATLGSQTVRADWDNSASMGIGNAGAAPTRKLIVLGVKGHPTVADTDIKTGYTFWYAKKKFTCVGIIPNQIGQIEATFEMVG